MFGAPIFKLRITCMCVSDSHVSRWCEHDSGVAIASSDESHSDTISTHVDFAHRTERTPLIHRGTKQNYDLKI
jgi:hypothetical protein